MSTTVGIFQNLLILLHFNIAINYELGLIILERMVDFYILR